MEIFLPLLLKLVLAVFIYMTLFYALSLYLKRADIVDIGWGLGFVLIALISMLHQAYLTDRPILVFFLVFLWGVRLSTHIYTRNKGKDEDYRYQQFRKDWGKNFKIRSYFQIFLLQGLFMLIVSLPISIIGAFSDTPLSYIDLVGALIWLVGFYIETTADLQLKKFISLKKNRDVKNRFANIGHWKYSRHPNYFGEILQWWGLWVLAISVPFGYFSIIGPVFITYLIVYVSGIPLLDRKFSEDKEWIKLKESTRMLIPIKKF